MSSKKLKFIDLFAGAGGFSCGLEQAGFECLLGIDFNKHAMDTFALNHKKAIALHAPIQELSNKKISRLLGDEKVNLVVGGPPCQGFSTVGKGNPEDERNTLFREFCRVVRFLKPEFIVMENVTGLLAKKNEETLISILNTFKRMGYTMDARVLESQHYGVPERRKRTILIGSRIGDQINFPIKTHDVLCGKMFVPAQTVGDALKSVLKTKKIQNHDLKSAEPKNKLDLKRIKKIPEGRYIRYREDEKKYFRSSALKLGIDWDELREGRLRQAKYFRLDRKKPSPTIMTHRHTYFHPNEDRYLTQREAAAIQSFPTNFVFSGPLSAQWRQIGNAVPPLMGKAIGKAIQKMYKSQIKTTGLKKKKSRTTKEINGLRSKAFSY